MQFFFTCLIRVLITSNLLGLAHAAAGQIVDGHFHIFSPKNSQKIDDEMIKGPVSGEDAVNLLTSAGVEKAIVLSAAYLFQSYEDAKYENDYVEREAYSQEGRFIPFCSVRLGASWALEEVERCLTKGSMKGLKLHPVANSLDLADEESWKVLESIINRVNQLQSQLHRTFPVIIDSNWQNRKITLKFVHLSAKFPKLKFILAHALSFDRMDLEIIGFYYQALPHLPRNIYVDLSAIIVFYEGSPDNDKFLWVLDKFGVDRVLFGSDYPVFSPQTALASLRTYKFRPHDLQGILGLNALRLWDNEGAF
ncbi:amidohydrolase family protein [Nocardioides sp.]|uniref:amidohydrolase family protein n=1 Tax=Nocardioides sp. TaxID=35761 RepID=UPI003D0F1C06